MLFPVGVKSAPPGLTRRPALRAREEVLERHVQERGARLGQHFSFEGEPRVHVDPAPAALRHPGGDLERAVDEDGLPVAHEDPRGDAREAVPGDEQAAGLVECRADEPAVCDARRGLVALAEGEGRLVTLDPFLRRSRKVDAVRVVAASPARGVVVRRYSVQRRPPRSK